MRAPQTEERTRFFDDRTRHDIVGVVVAVFAVILFVTAVMTPDALVTTFVSQGLHLILGLGAYVLPFFLLIVGASFLIRFERERVPLRIVIGLSMIFVAGLVLMALFTPGAPADLNLLFAPEQLVSRGGYIGAGIAWAGLKLFGQVISCILMAGVIVAGLVVIGFSISGLIERIRSNHVDYDESDMSALDSPSYARMALHPQNKHVDKAAASETAILSERRKPNRSTPQAEATQTQVLAPQGFDEPVAVDKAMTRKLGVKHRDASIEKKPTETLGVPAAEPHPAEGFHLPDLSLLGRSVDRPSNKESESSLRNTAECLQETLSDFGINADVVGWVAGPTVTLFKVDLPSGVRVSRVTALGDDLALALAAPGVRIFAPIPGTNYVGIEVPNRIRQTVLLGDILPDAKGGPLQIAIGKDVEGRSIVTDLSKMPHLLIGGTTGSGKSVSINAMIMSILMRATPSEVRFIMIDPKRVEFTPYNGIPHLYVPVVTEPREAASALAWGVAEMERRLKIFSKVGARNIAQYNAKVQQDLEKEEDSASELPYIVIIIDELADLMMNVGKEVEFSISRIAQLARAAGIHLIVATQRPSTNVVTGLIKANITNRIAFNVASGIDSRVVLDTPGAENLIGLGDLLFSKPEYPKPQRIQGCYVSEDEINAVVESLKEQGEPEYHSEILKTNLITLGASSPDGSGSSCSSDDPLLWEAAEAVVSSGFGSTSGIQRRLKVGYSRAGRIMDMLEEKGIVGPPNGSKPREILVDTLELETLKAFEAHDASDTSLTEE
ncbi:MAG: DNA translocase FtsK [Raoultibacter sp.]